MSEERLKISELFWFVKKAKELQKENPTFSSRELKIIREKGVLEFIRYRERSK